MNLNKKLEKKMAMLLSVTLQMFLIVLNLIRIKIFKDNNSMKSLIFRLKINKSHNNKEKDKTQKYQLRSLIEKIFNILILINLLIQVMIQDLQRKEKKLVMDIKQIMKRTKDLTVVHPKKL